MQQRSPTIPILKRVPLRYRIQRQVDWLFAVPFCLMFVVLFRWMGRYEVENLAQVRKQVRSLLEKPGPIVICGNHLTFIDSCLLIWAFATIPWYVRNYHRFSWNLPAGDFFGKKFTFRLVAYFGKCIFVHRDGTHRHKGEIVQIAKTLVAAGEALTIFPEGRRSRSGRFEIERLTYGAGKIIAEVPGCRVLCTYLRSDKQDSHSEYPARGSRFYLRIREIQPQFQPGARSAPEEVTRQIGQTILEMENTYFAEHAPVRSRREALAPV